MFLLHLPHKKTLAKPQIASLSSNRSNSHCATRCKWTDGDVHNRTQLRFKGNPTHTSLQPSILRHFAGLFPVLKSVFAPRNWAATSPRYRSSSAPGGPNSLFSCHYVFDQSANCRIKCSDCRLWRSFSTIFLLSPSGVFKCHTILTAR